MNSLLRLDENGLNLLSSTFREIETSRRSGGLGLNEFIDAVVNALGEGEAARTAKLEDELCKVFAEIDVDGDNTVTWEEFSSHCIDAGVAASTTPVDYSSLVRFRLQQEFNQPQGRQLSFVKYLSSLSLLAVGEANNQCVKFYDSNCSFLGDFSADADIAEVRLTLDGTKDLVRKGRGVGRHITASQKSSQRQHTVLDIEFCPGTGTRSASGAATLSDLGTLVTSTSDVCCSFFKVTRTVKGTLRISLVNRVFKNLRSPQTVCHWSSVFCKLFTSDDSGVLVIWTVDAASGGKSRRRDRIREHQSRITCMASSQRFQLLFTAGLDKQILQWSSNAARAKRIPTKSSGTRKGSRKSKNSKLRVTAKFCGHRLGVTGISLVLMDSVLVSVGFEYEVSNRLGSLLCFVLGTNALELCFRCIAGAPSGIRCCANSQAIVTHSSELWSVLSKAVVVLPARTLTICKNSSSALIWLEIFAPGQSHTCFALRTRLNACRN